MELFNNIHTTFILKSPVCFCGNDEETMEHLFYNCEQLCIQESSYSQHWNLNFWIFFYIECSQQSSTSTSQGREHWEFRIRQHWSSVKKCQFLGHSLGSIYWHIWYENGRLKQHNKTSRSIQWGSSQGC